MQFSSRFSLAVHILMCIETFGKEKKITSEFLAASTGVNPVMVRNLLGQLRNAGLVEVVRGTGGASLARPGSEINLLQVFRAVDCIEEGVLFRFHDSPDPECPVGRNIHLMLDPVLQSAQASLEKELEETTLTDLQKTASRHLTNKYGLRMYK